MKKYVIAWGFFLCCFVGAFAQMISVSGKVTDVTNHPLEGAAVVVKNDNILLSMGTTLLKSTFGTGDYHFKFYRCSGYGLPKSSQRANYFGLYQNKDRPAQPSA